MEKRRFGRTNHQSSVIIFGAASLWSVTQDEADAAIQLALDAGINHFDTAASYGVAEERMQPWMPKIRSSIFLATKTDGLTRDEAWREIEQSLRRMQVEYLDLEQLHEVNSMEKLDQLLRPDGGLQALIEAKEQGLVRFIGITGHGHQAPGVHWEALRRFPFDSVLTPYNFVLYANAQYRRDFDRLVAEVERQDVGFCTIKAVAKGPWPSPEAQHYNTWYEPFDDQAHIQQCINFVLSQPAIAGLPSAGDVHLLPSIIRAAEQYQPMTHAEQQALMATADRYASPFGEFSHP
ncbi:aldo/keto reductase [Sulfobacillus sp. hq2]|uniref:aldo/keto reductase n=1 Tax=Sulfobacillus sp. hq2 TaxID=2039167 RepID=UPI000CD0E851|nr:aldo/keto reductase [Sulfobacillus sp. hq2]POB11033.1 aldo/keto reductase [Sulfobacillus sp. hq2]